MRTSLTWGLLKQHSSPLSALTEWEYFTFSWCHHQAAASELEAPWEGDGQDAVQGEKPQRQSSDLVQGRQGARTFWQVSQLTFNSCLYYFALATWTRASFLLVNGCQVFCVHDFCTSCVPVSGLSSQMRVASQHWRWRTWHWMMKENTPARSASGKLQLSWWLTKVSQRKLDAVLDEPVWAWGSIRCISVSVRKHLVGQYEREAGLGQSEDPHCQNLNKIVIDSVCWYEAESVRATLN